MIAGRQPPFNRRMKVDRRARAILHVDMDAFFASIEQRDHPRYRGKPVIVGADPKGGKGRGVVAACSYEARKYGIHSAMPIGRAYRLCHEAIFVRPDAACYSQVSRSIMKVLSRFTDQVEPVSVDEAFLDVSGSLRLFGSPQELALAIKNTIGKEQNLTCSIGIAYNKFLAKLASDLCKPDGLLEVAKGTEKGFLKDLPVRRIWGVGPRTEERLRQWGISTIGDVAEQPADFWRQNLGRHGEHLWELSQGLDERPVQPAGGFRSLSQERTFSQDTNDGALLKQTLLFLSEQLARRARRHGVLARTLCLKLRYADFSTLTRQITLRQYTNDAQDIYKVTWKLLERFFPLVQKIRLLGIAMSRFQLQEKVQPDLFDLHHQKKSRLNSSLDAILSKFGENSIRKARLLSSPSEDDERFSAFLKK